MAGRTGGQRFYGAANLVRGVDAKGSQRIALAKQEQEARRNNTTQNLDCFIKVLEDKRNHKKIKHAAKSGDAHKAKMSKDGAPPVLTPIVPVSSQPPIVTSRCNPEDAIEGPQADSMVVVKIPAYRRRSTRCCFFNTAGETRNRIYEYVFDRSYLIEFIGPSKKYAIPDCIPTYSSIYDCTFRYTGRFGRAQKQEPSVAKWVTSIPPLHLVNKQLRCESTTYLFKKLGFYSQSIHTLNTICRLYPSTSLAHLRSLHLSHTTYGSPCLLRDEPWKRKHDACWASTCALAASALPNLYHLTLILDVHDNPFRLALSEPWVRPLLHFSKETHPHLKFVEVTVLSKLRHQLHVDLSSSGPGFLLAERSPRYVQRLVDNEFACAEIHRLFGDAVALKILGCSDEDAMEGFLEYVRDPDCKAVVQPAWMEYAR